MGGPPRGAKEPEGEAGGLFGRASETRSGDPIVQRYAQLLQLSLSREGRAPWVLGGITLHDDLRALQASLSRCLQTREEPHLRHWHRALSEILPAYTPAFLPVRQAQAWGDEVRSVLDAAPLPTLQEPGPGSLAVARTMAHTLGRFADLPLEDPWLRNFRTHLFDVSTRYWKGLFPCYDVVGLPRTNNELEREFGQIKQSLRRQLGLRDLRRPLQRQGAWLAYRPPPRPVGEVHTRLREVSWEAYQAERARWNARQAHFRNRYRWRHAPAKVLSELETAWASGSPDTS